MSARNLVGVPIFFGSPLRKNQCVMGVSWKRKRPFGMKIRSECDYKYSFSPLWHPVIRSIQQLKDEIVVKTLISSASFMLFQAGSMLWVLRRLAGLIP